jgi:hypothetical protein
MSKMLQALKNLSSRTTPGETVEQPAAAPARATAEPVPAADDPVLPPADRSRRMKDVLARHLAAPTPTEVIRRPAAEAERQRATDFPGPEAAPAAGSMTVPMDSQARLLRLAADPQRLDLPRQPPARLDLERSAPVAVAPTSIVDVPTTPEAPVSQPVGVASLEAVTALLSELENEPAGPEEEVSLSFSRPLQEREDRGRESGDRGPKAEVGGQTSEATPDSPAAPPPPLAPSPTLAAAPQAAAPSPLDHLADPRPLVTHDASEELSPPPAPLVLPPRAISRVKTRLEERVLDMQSDPSRSLPYRELADRLRQDLRLLPGRCLLFAGVGSASHADDVLPHVASLLAEDDAEVLLVDADFARAAMTVGFGALKETGLGDLTDAGSRAEELLLPTRLPNISLLPAGRKALPDNLGVVDRVAPLLAKLEERYSLVMIDGGAHTGPLLPALARLCDATYLVVRLGATDARAATTALQTFRGTGARVMGCVATSGPAAVSA